MLEHSRAEIEEEDSGFDRRWGYSCIRLHKLTSGIILRGGDYSLSLSDDRDDRRSTYDPPDSLIDEVIIGHSVHGSTPIPHEYDGVLDVVGPKDLKTRYNSWIGLPDTAGILPALEAECGGTPETKPKAYEKRSPTYNAALKVKTISLYGEDDTNVPPIQAEMFYDAVEAAGSLDYYRGYMYEGFGHGTFAANPSIATAHFMDLVDWVVNDIEPPTDPYVP